MTKKGKLDFSDIDDYVYRLLVRVSDIDKESKSWVNDITERNIILERTYTSVKEEIKYLRKSISAANEILEQQKSVIKLFSKEFKGIAKREMFDRVKEKVDTWNPEQFITKNQLKKLNL